MKAKSDTSPQIVWQFGSQNKTLVKEEVHVWAASLNLNKDQLTELWTLLSADEKQRALRFKFDKHRNRFIAARGILRKILSEYFQIPAEQLIFSYASHGKPYISNANTRLFFNMSDSENLAVYAVAKEHEVGIDVEFMPHDFDSLGIAKRFFSAYENQMLEQLPEAQKKVGFFNCWTRKEAFIKAIGEGLSYPLDQFDVSLTPDEPAAILRINHDAMAAKQWSLYALHPAPDYAAALAIEGTVKAVKCWCYNVGA